MTPQETWAAANTIEAQAIRKERQAARVGGRRHPNADHLAERQRLVAFWRDCAETNPGYIPHNGCWWPYRSRVFRFMLLPTVRARIDARDKAWDEKYRAELRDYSRRSELLKAERLAAKKRAKAPQADLFGAAA